MATDTSRNDPMNDTAPGLAGARALEDAAADARARGDVGQDCGPTVWDYLEHRARKAREATVDLELADQRDPRVAPAVNAYRRAMAAMGHTTALAEAAIAVRAALSAADKVA